MRNPKIECLLREYVSIMTKLYNWLTIKFEYNEEKDRYLVSYSPQNKIPNDDNFMRYSSFIEDYFNYVYGDLAPRFCDDEELFKLSPNAEIIKYENK